MSVYNADVSSEIPESVRKYAEMAYAAASAKMDEEHERKIADLRESLGKMGLSESSAMDRETARLHADRISAHVRAKAEALIEGFELHSKLDEAAAKAVIEDASKLYESVKTDLVGGVTNRAKIEAWRTRSSGFSAI